MQDASSYSGFNNRVCNQCKRCALCCNPSVVALCAVSVIGALPAQCSLASKANVPASFQR
eukprot:scaffold767_cov385-Pavlova_lutheri.AAC.6